MRISDWSSDVCSSDLLVDARRQEIRQRVGFIDQGFVIDVEHHAHRGLGIAVHDDNAVAAQGKIIGKVLARGRFADAALEVWHGHADGALGRPFAPLESEAFLNRAQILYQVKTYPEG